MLKKILCKVTYNLLEKKKFVEKLIKNKFVK